MLIKVFANSNWFSEFLHNLPSEIYVTFLIVIVVLILGIIVPIKARKADPLEKPKGILHLVEILVTFFDNLKESAMGKGFNGMAPYFMGVAIFIFLNFLVGLVGLPTPTASLIVPMALALLTVILIHATSVRTNKWGYFERYTSPSILFLPMNIISQFSPLISLSFRLFGNTLAGWSIMTLIYWALEMGSNFIFGFFMPAGVASIWLAPLITPWLHLYFDIFSGLIQTYVFVMLSMMFIAQEGPEEEDVPVQKFVDKAGNTITTLAKEN